MNGSSQTSLRHISQTISISSRTQHGNGSSESHVRHHRRCRYPEGYVAWFIRHERCLRHCHHKILLERLEVSFGVKGLALAWLRSFLMDRTQVVAFGGNKSTSRRLLYGVPQGSILGPLLFALYSADVIRIAATWSLYPCLCGRPADLHQLRRI